MAGFMVAETRQDAADKRTKQLLHYLDLAMDSKLGQETTVINLAAESLKGLAYFDENGIVFPRIPFLTCGENSVSQTDVWVRDDNEVLLLLQEDKRLTSMTDPEPQVIAEALATFALNNRKRIRSPLVTPLCSPVSPWFAPHQSSTKSPSLLH